MKKYYVVVLVICMCLLVGCGKETPKEKPPVDIEFAVISDEELPVELYEYIESKKAEEFKMTFIDGNYMYITMCYGRMTGRGYSIHIYDIKEYEDNITINAGLVAPINNNGDTKETYPYMVIKVENKNKKVIFKEEES